MGLIKAALGAAGGVLADQWKEYFYCEAIPSDVLAVKGRKKATGRSSNKHGDDNIITNGSVIAIADGQCMLIVEQGKVVDVCAEPGEYTYDMSTEPSIFSGDLGNLYFILCRRRPYAQGSCAAGMRMPLRMLEYSHRNHSPVEGFCRSFIGRGASAPAVFRNTLRYPGSISCGRGSGRTFST